MPAVLLATLAFGAVSSPVFDWPVDPFSLIGAADGRTATLFNAGVIVGGLVSLPFAVRLWRGWRPLIGALYAVVGLSFAGAGLVPAAPDAILHELFGAVVFLGIWPLLWTAGTVDWRAGNRRAGSAAFALGTVALLVWLPYDLGVTWAQVGYGAAELISLLAFTLWSVWTAIRLWDRPAHRASGEQREATL